MDDTYRDRNHSRPRGRPRAEEPALAPAVEAQPVMPLHGVPAIVAPCCGRAGQPRVERRRDDGSSDCICQACGRRFHYTPPRVALHVDDLGPAAPERRIR